MITRPQIFALLLIAVASIAAIRLIAGEQVSIGWFTSIGFAVTILDSLLIAAFNKWFWRWRLWQGWMVKRPYIGGDWQVKIDYQWADERGTVDATLSVRQTYTSIHARLKTDESQGDLISSQIVDEGSGRYKFTGIYRNEPRLEVRDRSQIHNGAFILDIEGDVLEPSSLRGQYWTDRDSKGEFIAQRSARTTG